MNTCAKCIRTDCKKRNTVKGFCFGWTPPANEQICNYFSPECKGQQKTNCGYWNGVCRCPQETMKGDK